MTITKIETNAGQTPSKPRRRRRSKKSVATPVAVRSEAEAPRGAGVRVEKPREAKPKSGNSRPERQRSRRSNTAKPVAEAATAPKAPARKKSASRAERSPKPSTGVRRTEIVGTLRAHPRGFGFLERPGEESIFVPPNRMRGLIDGDVVAARIAPGRDDAERTRLVTRTRTHSVGEIIDGKRVRLDIGVGDLDLAVSGDCPPVGTCVLIEIASETDAKVVEILGDSLTDDALMRRMLTRHQLPNGYTAEALEEADRIAGEEATSTRRDLTAQRVVTIDADHSQDLDDALAAEAGPDGSIRVWVHIADVAERITIGSVLDVAAAKTPTSIYLPTLTRHMLPPVLSAAQLSLLPEVDRDALTVEMRIDSHGDVLSCDVYESRIRSQRRLSYTTVARVLAGDSAEKVGITTDQAALVRQLWAAAVRLGQQRVARGGVDAWRAEPGSSEPESETDAHVLVERLMVATNEAVARWLEERGMPVLARVHDAPKDEAVSELETVATSIGLWAALPRPLTPQAFAALAAQASSTRNSRVFWEAAMGSFERARYTTELGGHFGLGSARYLHFTSPLRRYADLLVHRVVKSYLNGVRDIDSVFITEEAVIINDVARRSDLAEKHARRAVAIRSLKPRQVVTCSVIGVPNRGSVRVVVEDLDIIATLLVGERCPGIGERVKAKVKSADVLADRLELRLASDSK